MNTLRLHCPAKVNLALSVGAPLPDGMHPIASWMVAVAFGDDLTLEKTASETTFDIAFLDGRGEVDWPLEKDLAFRALGLLEQTVGHSLPVNVTLRKRIPAGAGLGGGSSNAAAALVGINDLYDLHLDDPTLINLGLQLGSDVGYLVGAMRGQTGAMVTGVGDTIEPLQRHDPLDLVLIFPGFGSPTGPVYGAFDRTHPTAPADADRVRAIAAMNPLPPDAPFNDLAAPACQVVPQLQALRDELAAELNTPVHVTGSGSTLFIVTPTAGEAVNMAQHIGPRAIATRTLAPRRA